MEDDLKKKMEDDLKKKNLKKKGRRPKQNGIQTKQPNST
jgi:hypothetical protein